MIQLASTNNDYYIAAAKSDVNASGFHELDNVTSGNYLSIRR